MEATQAELFEIVSQLGLTQFTPESSRQDMLSALDELGVDEATIAEQVEEQRRR
jgi:hypothetical protein